MYLRLLKGVLKMNRFKFWKWGRLRRLGRWAYIALFTLVWTFANMGLGIYRERTLMEWTWDEILTFQSQMFFFVLFSGMMIGWLTWDIGDDSDLKLGIDNHVLDTDRLILRKMNQTDFKALHDIYSDAKTMQFWPEPFTKDASRSWILQSMASYSHNGFGRYVVVRKKDGKIIGDVGLMLTSINGLREVDLGYIIKAEYQNKGYGFEATRACLEYGINELGLERIVAQMSVDNLASEKIAQKIGMQKQTTFLNKKNRNLPTLLYIKDQRIPG
jgi:RimJ/RimL family protein N-acetyltransferase